MSYTYNGNQVEAIDDPLGGLVYDGSFDFKPSGGADKYQYNSNGAVTRDPNKNIEIDYSEAGMPSHIQFCTTSNYTGYNYGLDGTKLKVYWGTTRQISKPGPGNGTWDEDRPIGQYSYPDTHSGDIVSNTEEYCGPFIFINGVLDKIIYNWGYCTLKDGNASFHYYIHDHLGSTRAVIAEDGTVEQQTGYYPFGGVYGDVSTNSELQGFKYTGKELDHQHGLDAYDFGARMYDPATAVWTSMDPLCEKYYNISPYAYCADNPINSIDPDGMDVTFTKLTVSKKDPNHYNQQNGLATKKVFKAINIVRRTKYGAKFFKEFIKSGYRLVIYSQVLTQDQKNRGYVLGNSEITHDKTNNRVQFELTIDDSNRSVGQIMETICHEISDHLNTNTINSVIDKFEKTGKGENGFNKAVDQFNKKSSHEEHLEQDQKKGIPGNTYYQLRNEIISKHPEYIKNFNDGIKNNHENVLHGQ